LLGIAACGGGLETGSIQAAESVAPSVGKADSTDAADHGCALVLLDVHRPFDDQGEYSTRCTEPGCSFVWAGQMDVAVDLGGSAPAVLYHRVSDPTWWEVPAQPVGPGGPGFMRYSFRLDEHLFGPEDAGEEIELIPLVRTAQGARLFDHNRIGGDLENYRLTAERGWDLWSDASVCTRRPGTAAIAFDAAFNEQVRGSLRAAGRLAIHYDLDRLPACRGTHNGYPAWDTTAFVQFLPSGQVIEGSLRAFFNVQGQPTNAAYPVPLIVDVPSDAEQVVLWFRNASGAGNTCESWDSDYEQNYHFEVSPSIDDDPCAEIEVWQDRYGGDPFCPAYEVSQQFDATNCEFHLNALGSGYEGHYGIPFRWLEAYLVVGPQDGQVLGAGIYVEYLDRADASQGRRWAFGREIEPGYFQTGLNYLFSGYMNDGSYQLDVLRFAFFLDVQRPAGEVVRLWQSRAGADYSLADGFSLPTAIHYIPYGRIEYANEDSGVLDSKRACQ
jgi:hypothetical protein